MLFFNWLFRRKKTPQPAIIPTSKPSASSIPLLADQRTRLENAPYLLPKDALEDSRLNYQHYVMYLSIGSHYIAPLPTAVSRILDVGTGTGIWAIEMANHFPMAQIVGCDITDTSFKTDLPRNCILTTGNILKGLPFPDQTFEYTHQRFLTAAIPAANWPGVIHELVRVTMPGGWIELLEIPNVFQNAGPETTRLTEWLARVSQTMGFDINSVPSIETWMRSEGLSFVETQDIIVPLGDWGGRVGSLLKKDMLAVFDASRAVICARSNTPPEIFTAFVQRAAAEWETYHTSYTFHAIYGKRTGR